MVSGKDDTDDVSLISVFSFLDLDLELSLATFVLVFVQTILQEYTSLSRCLGRSSCLLLCRMCGFSSCTLDLFLIVKVAASYDGKKACGVVNESSDGNK